MNRETTELYDRNIRLWGKDTQLKILKSQILLINLTPSITEVGKNLILAGMNLLLLDQGEVIIEEDCELNFFFNSNDIGKNKAERLKEIYENINTLISVQIVKYDDFICNKCIIHYAAFDLYGKEKEYCTIENILIQNEVITYYIDNFYSIGFFVNNIKEKEEGKNDNKEENECKIDICDEEENDDTNKDKVKDISEVIFIHDEKEEKDFININSLYTFCTLEEKLKHIQSYFNKTTSSIRKIEKIILPFALSLYYYKTDNYYNNNKISLFNKEIDETLKFIKDNKANHFFPVECVIAGCVSQELVNIIAPNKKINCNIYSYNCIRELGIFTNLD